MSTMLIQQELGLVMKMYREQAELPQDYMAKKYGCSQAFISAVEHGEKDPPLRLVHLYADETGQDMLRIMAAGPDSIMKMLGEYIEMKSTMLKFA